ncbi:MAG: hypothetical protein US60_C0036G0004 [Microgenomates group bacterium GW2011_GWC1_37_8]|uniref:Uncharacterized protein n=2 Tax=Candidatus Woeseibacteriota TaxID=1752722 RepID=A0A0G0LB00_9BACT|nr:MAG: hypothetical protein US60_C0036G0004 [Microgenomates group bacterium GW2011_GWC1_37_8]KKQ85050.1 MAG: hypothetical protein UT08_C0011G0068 [Candidatus Woesebacteria bacterium GW2011_GWB1_38_8]OGM21099.1 MAG: hypothetical protein A2863_03060 [Candidatus Woesebacteria bacterium RIFCSPHIGHO2_01_FULL_38_9b]
MIDPDKSMQDKPVHDSPLQDKHIRDIPQEPAQPVASGSVARAKQRTDEFVREMRYKTLLQGGLNSAQAAKMMGVKLRSGDRFKAGDILKMIVKGRNKP